MNAQQFLDERVQERSLQSFVLEVAELAGLLVEVVLDLLFVQATLEILVLAEAEDGPRAGRGRRVLSGHEEGDHDVRDLLVGQGFAGFVVLVLERSEHVLIGL